MAVCPICKKEMLEADGCIGGRLMIKGKAWPRIKVGDPGDYGNITDPDTYRCGDCGSKAGYYHHFGCDMERCPKCHGQLISCDCDDDTFLRYSAMDARE